MAFLCTGITFPTFRKSGNVSLLELRESMSAEVVGERKIVSSVVCLR